MDRDRKVLRWKIPGHAGSNMSLVQAHYDGGMRMEVCMFT